MVEYLEGKQLTEKSVAPAESLPIDKVVERLEERITEIPLGDPAFADPRYTPINLDTGNFHPIVDREMDCTLCFLDGGNINVARAPNFIVELTRLYFGKYRGGRRLNPLQIPQRIDFYTVCYATSRKGRIIYETELIPVREEWRDFLPDAKDLIFDSLDRSIMVGLQRASVDKVSSSARVFAEWKLAGFLAEKELEEGDILVKDGSLQTFVTNERKYANRAYGKAMERGATFTGLAKTSTLFTTTGHPLVSAISELSQTTGFRDKAWYYHPIVVIKQPDHRADMYAVKLHPQADYVFRFEILREQAEQLPTEAKERVIAALADNAKDISFPGYPYGLIDADRFGRVGMGEKEMQQTLFMSTASAHGAWPKIQRFIRATDAHLRLNEL